jgi:hypothetical protein
MKANTPNPAESGAAPRKPYRAPELKEFGTIAELTQATALANTAKDNLPANTKT